ncbi:MAG: alkaline phosphatase family protein [Candidatus Eisenbacteria bacterium]
MSTRAVLLVVDALGWELACGAPGFARGLASRRRLDTVLGFSTGALPTLFTGRMPSEHGRWVMYRRAGSDTCFRGFGALRWLPPRVRDSWRLSRMLHRVVERRGVRGYFQLYEVPRSLLERFDLGERDDIFSPGGLPVDSLWDSITRRGLPWSHWDWRTPEPVAMAALERRLSEGDERLLVLYTADLDALLHREGSGGTGVRERLARYSAWLERLDALARARGDTLWLYVISDHGMVDVTRHVDVMGRLAPIAPRMPRDYLAFYDSTMARFWWADTRAREKIRETLSGVPGRWLDTETLTGMGCGFADRAYGDDVFLLEAGVLLVPSFMGSAPVAAMHGYDPSHPDMAALLLSNRPVPDHLKRLADVRTWFESELDALGREAA